MLLLLHSLLWGVTQGCTCLIVTKGASAENANMVTQNDDAGGGTVDLRLTPVPAADWPIGSKRPVYQPVNGYPRFVTKSMGPHYYPVDGQKESTPLGYIDQVPHTYGYWANHYGIINEKGLAMGESTCGARTAGWPSSKPYGFNMMGIEVMSHIGLERCATARCAIQTMGDLAVQYGFWSDDSGNPERPGYGDSAESLGICDKEECWVFFVLTGPRNASAVWAAQRIPDGHVSIIANSISIRKIDLNDKDTYMASPNIYSAAEEMGFWYPESGIEFDFFRVYGNQDSVDDLNTATILSLYSGRRIWRVQSKAAPSLPLNPSWGQSAWPPTYQVSVMAERKFGIDDVWLLMRDYYQDTSYDLSQGLAAGPFHSPLRYDGPSYGMDGEWERGIYIFRNMFSHVAVLRDLPSPLAPIFYYALDNSVSSVYVPFFAATKTVPSSYLAVKESVYDSNSMFWVFNVVGNFVHLRFDRMIIDVRKEQRSLENIGKAMVQRLTASSLAGTLKEPVATAAAEQIQHAAYVQDAWRALRNRLFEKFSNGWVTTGERWPWQQEMAGYPVWWLKIVDWVEFPRDGVLPLVTKQLMAKEAAKRAANPATFFSLNSPTSPGLFVSYLTLMVSVMCLVGLGVVSWKRATERGGNTSVLSFAGVRRFMYASLD
eukprot:gb/GEZN01002688.1/.p1 GENE.gb/GEZN01002688.1/~~gb/GEZN01002688.1/.p1  ORF type:complete len:657 (-),score=84.42 gb/GEZN01002688.1/:379-2349(-)